MTAMVEAAKEKLTTKKKKKKESNAGKWHCWCCFEDQRYLLPGAILFKTELAWLGAH